MSSGMFLAVGACFRTCVAIYNLVEGDRPAAFENFGIAAGSVFSEFWTQKVDQRMVEKVCREAEADLLAYFRSERIEAPDAVLSDVREHGPTYLAPVIAVSALDLVREANGRPEALTAIVLKKAAEKHALPRRAQTTWQQAFADENSTHHRALKAVLDVIHARLYATSSPRENLTFELAADTNLKVNQLLEVLNARQLSVANAASIKEYLKPAIQELERIATRQSNQHSLAEEALVRSDPHKGYEALLAEADGILEDRDRAVRLSNISAASSCRNAASIIMLKDMAKAERALERATQLDPSDAQAWLLLGKVWLERGNPKEAFRAHLIGLKIAKSSNDRKTRAECYAALGVYFKTIGHVRKSRCLHSAALAINRDISDQEGIAQCLGNMGLLELVHGDPEASLGLFQQSLKIERRLCRRNGISADLGNLGWAYEKLGDFEAALQCLWEGIDIDKQLDKKFGLSAKYGTVGNVYRRKSKFYEAIHYYQLSLSISEKNGFAELSANQYYSIGYCLMNLGRPMEARGFFLLSLRLDKKIGRSYIFEQTINLLGH
ncbi:MAG: tetratricopeptide repeat protein [Pseudomonadota bacterium]